MNANLKTFAVWVVIVLLLLALVTLFQNPGQRTPSQDISFSQLLNAVDQGHVRSVEIQGNRIQGYFTDGRRFETYSPNDPTLIQRLQAKGVSITATPAAEGVQWWLSLFISWLPFLGLIAVWIFLSRWMRPAAQGQGQGQVTRAEIEGLRRQLADMQQQIDRLNDKNKS